MEFVGNYLTNLKFCHFVLLGLKGIYWEPPPSFIEIYDWQNKNCIYLSYTMWWFNIHILCEMVIMINLIFPSPDIGILYVCWEHIRSTLLTHFKYTIEFH